MDGQPGKFGHAAAAAGNAYPAAATATAAIDPPAPATRRRSAPAAFTLIEILIVVVILGIIAAIVVPQFSNASHVARENTLKDDLRYLRTQLAVYKAQHRDTPPGYIGPDRSAFNVVLAVNQLKSRTDASGTIGDDPKTHPFGPYLQGMPVNPLTQAAGVMPLNRTDPLPKTPGGSVTADGQKTYGWIYKPDTLEIIPYSVETDGRGRPYLQY